MVEVSSACCSLSSADERMKELVGMSSTPSVLAKSKHADINIFTVASGLLYEVSRLRWSDSTL
jgi:hypothetical protein